jgi:3-dehydroquinate synthase II
VLSNDDITEIAQAAESGSEIVVVEAFDWKIIPLENIIAKLHKSRTKIYATAKNANEVRIMFGVLELGVDGVILSTNNVNEVNQSRQYLENMVFPIETAKIIDVKDVGMGERVCVDTVSMLKTGEGMLIGSRSNFMFLVHNESVGSSFTSPRPFRVNAGAVYCYTITPDGNTKYLSEIESGTEILIVNKEGTSRRATVGRAKIETRPLRLIRAEIGNEIGTVILQNAETIRFITDNGNLIPVTELKLGDEVLAYTKMPSGRHFGLEVKEFVVEK